MAFSYIILLWHNNIITVVSQVSVHGHLNITRDFGPHGRLPRIKIPYVCIEASTVAPWNVVHGPRALTREWALARDTTVCYYGNNNVIDSNVTKTIESCSKTNKTRNRVTVYMQCLYGGALVYYTRPSPPFGARSGGMRRVQVHTTAPIIYYYYTSDIMTESKPQQLSHCHPHPMTTSYKPGHYK